MAESRADKTARSLRVLRAERGLSQRDVCRGTGTNPQTMCQWEKRAGMTLASAWKLADFYGCTLDELAGRDE